MSPQLEQRIVELESRLEFQDATIATLNDALVKYERSLSDLQGTVDLLVAKYREAQSGSDGLGEGPSESPPPHY